MNEIQTIEIKQIELEINFYKKQTVQSIFEIGNRLIKAKELVPYGEWEDWLKNKVEFSNRRAQQFMKVSREFKETNTSSFLTLDKMLELTTLDKEERETFIEENPVEDMTTRELRQAIKDKKELEQKIQDLESRPTRTIEVVKEVPVVPEDYQYYKDKSNERGALLKQAEDKVRDLNRKVQDKAIELEKATNEKSILERKAKLNEEESKKYNQLKDQIENLSKQKDDLGRQIKSRTELSGLVVRVEHMLKTELAPIKYSRAIRESSKDEIVTRNLRDIVNRVEDWCNEMYQYVGNDNIINVEVIDYE